MYGLVRMKLMHPIRFNQLAIRRYLDKTEKRLLQKVGARARALTMREITRAPLGTPSQPGQPFHSHPVKGKADSGIKRSVQYAYSANTRSVIIGPVFAQELFERHEFGGVFRAKNRRRRKRKIGDAGIIEIGRTAKRNRRGRRYVMLPDPKHPGRKNVTPVTFARIRTQQQLDRVNTLEEQVYGPFEGPPVTYAPRPVFRTMLARHGAELTAAIRDIYGVSEPEAAAG